MRRSKHSAPRKSRKAWEEEQQARAASWRARLDEQVSKVTLIARNGSCQEKMNLIRMYTESRDFEYSYWIYRAMVSLMDDPDVGVVRAFLYAPMSRLPDYFRKGGHSYPDYDAMKIYLKAGRKFIYHPDLEIGRALLMQVGNWGWRPYHDDFQFSVNVFLTQLAQCNPNREVREEAVRLIDVRKAEKEAWEAYKRSEHDRYLEQAEKEERERRRGPEPPYLPWY